MIYTYYVIITLSQYTESTVKPERIIAVCAFLSLRDIIVVITTSYIYLHLIRKKINGGKMLTGKLPVKKCLSFSVYVYNINNIMSCNMWMIMTPPAEPNQNMETLIYCTTDGLMPLTEHWNCNIPQAHLHRFK